MNREEILRKAQNQPAGGDEREKQIVSKAAGIGFFTALVACGAMEIFNGRYGQLSGDMQTVVTLGVAIQCFYVWRHIKKTFYLALGIVCLGLSAICCAEYVFRVMGWPVPGWMFW